MARRFRDFDRWVRLSLRIGLQGLFVDYEDETGHRVPGSSRVRRRSPVEPAHAEPIALGLRTLQDLWPGLYLPPGLDGLLRAGFADRPEARPHWLPESVDLDKPVPWLLPVFIVPPAFLAHRPWETWLQPLILRTVDLASRCMLLRESPTVSRSPIQLPLRFEQAGGNGDWFADVRKRNWYAGNAAVREFGFQFGQAGETPSGHPHVVVRPFGAPLPRRLLSREATRPLVVLTIATSCPTDKVRVEAPAAEAGISHMLVLPRNRGEVVSATDVVSQVVYGLVHDFALHEIAWILGRTIPKALVWIASDSQGIHALRLSSVMRQIVDDALSGGRTQDSRPGIGDPEVRGRLRSLAMDFRFESHGLTAMANYLAGADEAQRQPRSTDPSALEGAPESRRADIAIERYDAFGVLFPMQAYERASPLQPGWRYRLRVHIGTPDEASAVVGDVPSIDELLPPPIDSSPRAIEVAVFAKRFELLSPGLLTIQLPARGSTAPVYFELRAPQEIGRADLRIALYSENNLIQCFVLDALVDEGASPEPGVGPSVLVRLDSSGIEDFATAPRLGERELSVGLNDDVSPGSHTVMLKGTGWREELWLDARDADGFMDRFRDVLKLASADPGAPFESTMREMAAIGQEIWVKLTMEDRADGQSLESLRASFGKTVQFVRYGSGRPFPWQTVYDYGLATGEQFLESRICLANGPVRPLPARGKIGCPHCPGENVVCIEGFWAARHRIEFLREDRPGAAGTVPRATRASVSPPFPLVSVGVGTPSGEASRFLQSLTTLFDNDFHVIAKEDLPVVDWLWGTGRPAVLVFLSHLERANQKTRLPTLLRAFNLQSPDSEISVPQLATKRNQGLWQEPQRPLVLLLACQSARQELGELTNLLDAFLQLGAAGVAATEWDVKTDLATAFGGQIIRDLLGDKPIALGDSVRKFVYGALRNREALTFAFTVYGDADLTAGRPSP